MQGEFLFCSALFIKIAKRETYFHVYGTKATYILIKQTFIYFNTTMNSIALCWFSFWSNRESQVGRVSEVVYVGVLHPQHLEVAKMCLEQGKSVVCEKPLCMNLKETQELVKV